MSYRGRPSNWWKRTLSVALAQLLAVQFVLGAALAVQMASPATAGTAIICDGDHGGLPGDNNQGNVGHHELCAVCAFAAHASALPGTISVHYAGRSVAHALQPDLLAAAAFARQHTPRTSQGPPLNA